MKCIVCNGDISEYTEGEICVWCEEQIELDWLPIDDEVK